MTDLHSTYCLFMQINSLEHPCYCMHKEPGQTHRMWGTLVVRHAHGTITLVVGHAGPEGTVDRNLQVVGSQPVSMCVRIGEETTLEKSEEKPCETVCFVYLFIHMDVVRSCVSRRELEHRNLDWSSFLSKVTGAAKNFTESFYLLY